MHSWKLKALGYLSRAWSYRWQGLAVAWIACLAGWVGIAAIPDRFQVAAKVFIDTDSLMGPLLKGLVVNSDTAQQIPIMLSRLITRPNLEQVVRLTHPDAAKFTPAEMDEQITRIQKDVSVKSLGTKNFYTIGYTDNNNAYALSVTQTLLSILVDSNIGDKRRDTEEAQTFIDKRISEYEVLLRQAEKRRADFKEANLEYATPGGGAARLATATEKLAGANQERGSAITRRDALRQQLQATPQTVAANASTVVIGDGDPSRARRGEILRGSPSQMLAQARQQLSELRLKYTDDFPDVIATQNVIARLQQEILASPPQAGADVDAPPGAPNPVFVQLRARLTEEEVNVAVATHRVEEATQELAAARAMIGKALAIEREVSGIDRDYNVISENYQALLKSRESARMGQAVSDEQSPIAFDVVEPPVEAQFPVSPYRLALNTLVLFAGIAGGAAFAFILSLAADRFVVAADLSAQFGLPIIGVVTQLRQASGRSAQALSAAAMTASVGLLFAAYVGVVVLAHDSLYRYVGG
jgi:protein tyrosine kinase modulator